MFLLQVSEGRDLVTEYNSLLHGDFSWMVKVNPARSEEEQNMEAIHSSDDEIYFRTTRDITAGEELRIWLAPSLEQEYGIHAPISEEGIGGQFCLKFCRFSLRKISMVKIGRDCYFALFSTAALNRKCAILNHNCSNNSYSIFKAWKYKKPSRMLLSREHLIFFAKIAEAYATRK